ncbi:uncharacterized protein [Aristolochia californica]|uniref:uncharacterized protein n=1 Tax=Aristolochia californica TaxID=171875 RepID=UPI0035D9B97E
MRKAAKEDMELLLGGGEESTIRRHNLQTNAGITYVVESIIKSLRRTRGLMVQEEEGKYKHIILYVVSKCFGLLKLQRKLTTTIKLGSMGVQEIIGGVATLLVEEDPL